MASLGWFSSSWRTAALIVPSFINWNDYKDEIAAAGVSKLTGRTLVIGGDIGLTLLPALGVVAEDVRLANIDAPRPRT